MSKGDFIWADLSTYDPASSIAFYSKIFGWKTTDIEDYHLAENCNSFVAGIYQTPPFFQKIKMPHFWMSYFQVNSIEDAIEKAEALGGKVELKNEKFQKGTIALIRDPQGAGFTIYDGSDLFFDSSLTKGAIVETELHVSDAQRILEFYSAIFDWDYSEIGNDSYQVIANGQSTNISIREIPNSSKGKFEYWVTSILVENVAKITELIIANGGALISQEKGRNLMTDNSQEAFFYIKGHKNEENRS